jgi:osmotically-inducible protein OsmY
MASASLATPGFRRTDELTQRIAFAIRAATGWPSSNVGIDAEEGIVTLHGRTRSFYEKQLIIHAARHVPGVQQIVDEMDVVPMASR